MYTSRSHSVGRTAWTVLRVGLYAAFAGIVLFFALTRTEVGRDHLRTQIEVAFDEQFAGELRIGSLRGTLLYDLYASDVRLRDESGRLVASVDSVSAAPDWTSLLTGEVSMAFLTLFRPHLFLHRHADGTWNARRALKRQTASASDRPLDLSLSRIAVQNGRVTTSRSGAPPSLVDENWLFDYTRSSIRDLSVEAAIKWTETHRRLTIGPIQGRLPDQDLRFRAAPLEVTRRGAKWVVEGASAQVGNTHLTAKATVEPAPSDSGRAALDLQVAESRIDNDELRRLVPRLPTRDILTVEGQLGGSLDQFVVNELTLSHGASSLTLEGTAFGLPDSLDLDAQILRSRVRPADLRAVWPEAPLDRVAAIGPVDLEASLRGLIEWRNRPHPTFDLSGTLSAQGGAGAVQGSLDADRAAGARLRYDGTLSVDSLNLAPLTGRPALDSRLTGQVVLQGAGTDPASLRSSVAATLAASRVGRRRISGGAVQGTIDRQTAQVEMRVRQPDDGTLMLRGTVEDRQTTPSYELTASTRAFDLTALSRALPSSALNATVSAQGRGASWANLTGTVEVAIDSSALRRNGKTLPLPPHRTTLRLTAPSTSQPRLRIDGTIASLTIDGTPLHPAVRAAGRAWWTAARHTVRDHLLQSRAAADSTRPSDSPRPVSAADRARALLDRTDVPAPLTLEGDLAIHRMDLLHLWWPGTPEAGDALRATSDVTLGPDTIAASGTLTAARVQAGPRRVASLEASYSVSGPLRSNLVDALTASLSVQADTLQLRDRALLRPSATGAIAEGAGGLAARAEGLGEAGPFRLASDVRLKRGLRFRVTDLYVGVGADAWQTTRPGGVTVYRNALVVDSLQMKSPRPNTRKQQTFELHGTLSSRPSDTLHANMTDVLLYPLGQLASLPRPLGGRLDGEIAVTGGWEQPLVRSAFTVHRLTFDRRLLGDLQVNTNLTPGRPDLRLDAALSPSAGTLAELEGPPLVPGGPRTVEENRLTVNGRIRLPGWSARTPVPSSAPLDLTVDVERADLFFFKYIFEESLATVRGYTAGSVHVGGRYRDPIFDAQLDIRDGRFTLPKFGLAYTASGAVRVDRRGIHIQEATVRDDEGSAAVTGSILFNEYKYFSFDLSAQLDELSIIDVADAQDLAFYGDIRASGPASLTGPLQDATLRSEQARTTPESELFIPVSESGVDDGTGFIVFADSTGRIPDLRDLTRRDNILSDRPAGEPSFLEGLEIDINVIAPEESTVHLVFDPVVGDVVTAIGAGRVQLQRQEGEFFVYGNFNVTDGTYLFTAGEVFVRRFNINGGTITWDGTPINAELNIQAEYRTRASPAGLPGYDDDSGRIPVRVLLDIGGRVETPQVDLSLARVRDERSSLVGSRTLDAILNQDRTTEYATSVLLTNTFLLTTESFTQGQTTTQTGTSGSLTTAGNRLAFNSVSQLVASQLNRYLGAALPNVDLNFGLQGEDAEDLDLIYGVALRLLNERLVIRGEGVYTGDDPGSSRAAGPQGEFVVEVRLSSRVSVEAFYRRSGDELTQGETLTSSTGAGLSYQTEFPTWRVLFGRVFGWLFPDLRSPDSDSAPDESDDAPDEEAPPEPDPVARRGGPSSDSTTTASPPPDGE